jgi:transposase InsO family protein
MHDHRNATLGPAGRRRIVEAVEGGMSQKRAAARFCVSPATVNRWVRRARAAGACERELGSCFEARSSRPHRFPRMLCPEDQQRICALRSHTGWGPRLVAGVVGRAHSTVHKVLRRHGLSRSPRSRPEPVSRYEWPCPGDLVHMDVKRFVRFSHPGWAATGDRRGPSKGAGYEFAHSIVDDHSRLAYSEVHDDESAQTVVAFLERALRFFEANGIAVRRLMSDNAWAYTNSRKLRELLEARDIRHLFIKPYRPQQNGKVERFQQTLAREWAYGLPYRSSAHRRRALPHWIRYYNERRPHSSIGDRPPVSRVHNLRG